MTLYLPPSISRELLDRTRSFREDAFRSVDHADSVALEWTAKLQAIDPRLMMVRARETVIAGVPLKPGYYHVTVDDGRLLSFSVVEGEDGRFTEPTSRVFEKLAAGDIRERRNLERFIASERAEREANDAERARERERRRDHLKDLVNAYTRTSVPGPGVGPWRQNQAGHQRGG